MRPPAPNVDLRPDHWAIVRSALRRHVPDREVLAFGSRATWTAKEYSDLDLAVMGEEPLSLRTASALDEALGDSDLPFKVDIVDWARIDDAFRSLIRRNGVVLQGWGQRAGADGFETHSPTPPRRSRMLAEWTRTTLGELLSFSNGKSSPARSEFLPHPVYGSNGIIGFADESNAGPNTIIIGRVGTYCGSLHYSDSACWVTDNAIRATAIGRNKPSFLSYLLRTLRLNARRTGSGQPLLNQTILSEIPVVVPHPREQGAIAHVLGTLDDKIELNRRMNETLEGMARALFKSWFVDFDPVRAKMEGRDTSLPRDIADLFPDRMVDSEMGEVPEAWQPGTLNDLARLNPESWSSRNTPDCIRYVDLANTKWGFINDIQEFTWEDAPSRGRRILRRGDTIVGTVRPRNGSFALIDRDGLTGSTAFAVLRPTTPTERELVWCAATSRNAIERLAHLADGGAYPAVRPRAILDTAVALPTARIRLVFSSLAAPLVNRMGATQRESRTLAALRDTLLPKLISGEIRVPDTAALLQSVY